MVDAGTAAMLIQVSPVLIALLAAMFLGERFTVHLGVGLALAFGGVALIAFSTSPDGSGGSSDLVGVLLCLVSAVAYSISLILQKPLMVRLPAVQVTWLACTVGAISCLPFAGDLVSQAQDAPASSIWWLVYLGVFPTAIAFTTYAFALKHMSASNLGVTTYLVPPITIVLGRDLPQRGARPRWRTPAACSPWSASPSPAASPAPAPTPARRPRRSAGRFPVTGTPLTGATPVSADPGTGETVSHSSPGPRASSPSGPRNASRLRVGSPRETRQSHSLRIEEAKPSSRMVLNEPSAYSRTAPSSRSISSVGDPAQRQPRVEVDVAHAVEREGHGVHLHVALEQPPVDALEVLVGLAAHERVHLQRVLADVEAARRLQLLLAGQGHHQRGRRDLGPLQLALLEDRAQRGQRLLRARGLSSRRRRQSRRVRIDATGRAHSAIPLRSARIFSCASA